MAETSLNERFRAPGIYLDLPEDEYFADPSIGGSGLKHFIYEAQEWWWGSPFNPLRPELEPDSKASSGKRFGKALHKAVLEGLEAYEEEYALAFNPDSHPDALTSSDEIAALIDEHNAANFDETALHTAQDIRDALKDLGLKVSGSKADITKRLLKADPTANVATFTPVSTSGSKEELIARVRNLGLDCDLMSEHEAAHNAAIGERIPISTEWDKSIRVMAQIARLDKEVSAILSEGIPEVSIFWREDEVPCRARIDWMRVDSDNDLKSFAGRSGKPVTASCVSAITSYRYDLQEVHYRAARAAMRDLPIFGGTPEQRAYVKRCQKTEEPFFRFIFCKSIGAPILRTGQNPRMVWESAAHERKKAFAAWREYYAEFGLDEPWLSPSIDLDLDTSHYPAWFGVTP